MHLSCPKCSLQPDYVSDCRTIIRHGRFYRTSDSKSVERFKCVLCKRTFSHATIDACFLQKKRQKNLKLFELLASGVSQRRSARLLRINRTTVARRLIFLGAQAKEKLFFMTALSKVQQMEFDDLETFEGTKYKPLSVILAVEAPSRRILGFRVARMGAKGILAKRSIEKYGRIFDERSQRRKELFSELKPVVQDDALIRSDSNPYYVNDVKSYFPNCVHDPYIGRRGAVTGQGELKKTKFDPIFSLNHTCAMYRANVARLIRKTWCTTKKRERLADHLAIYALYHNQHLN